jgi:glutamate-ammonia-ligase adenylyltransferase
LAREFLTAIEPFVYRKYLSFAEINEVKALKRKMEQNAGRTAATEISGDIPHDLKTGRGGIRDIEYAVQFLQLLNGGDLPAVRQRNTLLALEALEITGCLTSTETFRLADAYRFLRKTEHRLQLLFDLQTHKLPTSPEELRKLALRMGYQEKSLEEAWKNKEPGAKEERDEASTASTEGTLFSSSTASNIDDSALPRSALVPQRETIAAGPLSATGLAPQKRSPIDESAPPPLDTRDLLIDPLDQFLKDLHDKTNHDRTILNHLLHQTFQDAGLFPRSSGASSASGANLSGETSAPRAATPGGSVAGVAGEISGEPEADLILDPEPDDITVRSVMSRYPFRDIPKAFTNLSQLARESVPFLSSRRCRHFLASIAPQLLRTVSETPDPDEALTQLERVSASLGAKAVLWELFSQNPPILKLYVELCAGSPFLSGLLINNPGMIDELLDSLVLNQPRTPEELRSELAELCRGARDLDPILHSFQDKEFLRIGVSDLLGKAAIRQTTAALSDVADTVLNQVAELMEPAVESRWGQPIASGSVANGAMKRYALLGLGKLGGREISYHSDLDLLLVYDVEGRTTTGEPNSQYFTELAQRVIKTLSQMGSMGRLYSVDMRLRPTGKSGALVLPLAELQRYFEGPACQLWERQSLSRARVIRSEPAFAAEVTTRIQEAMLGQSWCSRLADELVAMRQKLVSTASPRSLKRGPGGIVDIEFVVQLLLIKYGREHPEILRSNVWESLDALKSAALLSTCRRPPERLFVSAPGGGAAPHRHRPTAYGGSRSTGRSG